jgi:mRNA interferase RelE/StbE
MVSYNTVIHQHAERALNGLPEKEQHTLRETLQAVAKCEEPSQHEKVRAMEGQAGMYRVRVGDYRAIYTLEKPYLVVVAVGSRKNVYENVDELHQRVEAF